MGVFSDVKALNNGGSRIYKGQKEMLPQVEALMPRFAGSSGAQFGNKLIIYRVQASIWMLLNKNKKTFKS